MFNRDFVLKEVNFKAVLSAGPGGQHANKTSTKVVLNWSLINSECFSEEQKEQIVAIYKEHGAAGLEFEVEEDGVEDAETV